MYWALAKLGVFVDADMSAAATTAATSRNANLTAALLTDLLWALAVSDQLQPALAVPLLQALGQAPVDGFGGHSYMQLATVRSNAHEHSIQKYRMPCPVLPTNPTSLWLHILAAWRSMILLPVQVRGSMRQRDGALFEQHVPRALTQLIDNALDNEQRTSPHHQYKVVFRSVPPHTFALLHLREPKPWRSSKHHERPSS